MTPARAQRLDSIDVVRGLVMVLMAIDHVRVYAGVPAGGQTPGVFFTRWVTHFCAPAFVFLAGTAAYFHGRKLGDRARLARYLATRGILLVLLEPTLIRLGWTFGLEYSQPILAGIIWMLGSCMLLMAALVWMPPRVLGIAGLVVILAQDLLRPALGALPFSIPTQVLSQLLYLGGDFELAGRPKVTILYVIVPWIGVIAAGYGFGAVMARERAERRRWCVRVGFAATAAFLVIAAIGAARGGGAPWFVRLLNQRKYPASQLFLLMTLGPTIALLPFVEDVRGAVGRMLRTFGRVPLFYYVFHIPLIHATALVVNVVRAGESGAAWYATAPYVQVPPEQRWSLALLYLVWAIDVAVLYVACRWFAALKARRRDAWLSYT